MMTALLLYSYCCGIYSSRRISKACRERVDFMSIVALDAPDFRTISEFRRRHLRALAGLFKQILQLCEKADLVKLGHVALDGTKIKANASKHKAMSYERMEKRAAELEAEVGKWLSAAAAADAEEDKLHGRDKTGDEMPEWVADKKRRGERRKENGGGGKGEEEEGRRKEKGGTDRKLSRPPLSQMQKPRRTSPIPTAASRRARTGSCRPTTPRLPLTQKRRLIVAQDLTPSAVDSGQLVPMTDAIETNLGRKPEQLSADAGYCSEANLEALENRSIDGYVATGRARDAVAGTVKGEITATTPSPEPAGAPTRVEAMRAKIRAGGHASPYRLRKQLPEPVFGQIKQARGFRQFLLRGFANVRAEWAIVCTVHNLLKLAAAKLAQTWSLSAALPPALAAP